MSEKTYTIETCQREEISVWINIELIWGTDLPDAFHLHVCLCAPQIA